MKPRTNNLTALLISFGVVAASRAPAETLTVGPSATYTDIQSAVDAASPADTISVEPGTYQGPVLISAAKAGLKLKSTGGRAVTTILGTPNADTIRIASGADNVEIGGSDAGFTIQGADEVNPGMERATVYFAGNNSGSSVIGNEIVAGGESGILTEYAGTVSDLTISGNLLSGATYDTSSPVPLPPGDQFSVANWPRPLVYVGNLPKKSGIVFTGNTITASTGVAGNGNVAINIDANGAEISGNVFSGTTGGKPGVATLRLRGAGADVTGNTFNGSGDVALEIGSGSQDTALTSEVTGNSFLGTYGTSLLNAGTSPLNATENHWGAPSGPAAGQISGNAVFLPFYADAALTSLDAPVKIIAKSGYYSTIAAAITAAEAGDTISLNAGLFSEAPIVVGKAVTISGANAGVTGTATRGAESRISNTGITVTAAGAVIDGVEIHQTNTTQDAVLLTAGSTVSNSILRRESPTPGNFSRAITTAVGVTGVTISGNLFTGDFSGSVFSGHKTWQSGIYSNGGAASITGNTFEYVRTALNLDDFNSSIVISGNVLRSCGTNFSFGGVTPTDGATTISGNELTLDFTPTGLPSSLFNLSNVAAGFRLDATGNTFGGIAAGSLTSTQKFAIESRTLHRGRSGRNGVVDYSPGEQIVVSGTTIASAILASSDGGTVLVGPETFTEDVLIDKEIALKGTGAGSTTLVGPIGGPSATIQIGASNVTVDGFTITRAGNNPTDWNNASLNSPGVQIQGQSLAGTLISNNEITGNRSGLDINNSNGHTLRNNRIHNNHTGIIFRNQTDNMTVEENEITGNRTVGILFLDASAGTNTPVQSAANSTFSNNNISGNWYGGVVDRQDGGSLLPPGTNLKNFEGNWFGGDTPVLSTANSAEPGYAALIPTVFGGSATAPAAQPDIAGPASANIDFISFLSVGTDTDIETTPGRGTYGFQGNVDSLWDGETDEVVINGTETAGNYFIPTGTTVVIGSTGSLTVTGLKIAPGASLVVNGGTLTLGDGSTISGTFTIFNSFGSWNINADTVFEISRTLALVSDIHVAPGITLTVNGGGELILDGSIINSQTPGSPFNIDVEPDGLLTIARSVVSDAVINIDTSTTAFPTHVVSKIYDSRFADSDIEASATSKVYHNLFDSGTAAASNTDGTAAFADVDAWGNVTDAADLKNRMLLDFAAPTDPTRTLDPDGNLFVQPSDSVVMNLSVADLGTNTISAAEALIGYNSSLLTLNASPDAVSPEDDWSVIQEVASVPGSIGLVDSALGLDLEAGDDGISTDGTIARVNFTALAPGLTVGFFRVQTARVFDDNGYLTKDTRLTKSASGVPSYLTAFTANTGELIIDDEIPSIDTPALTGDQVQPSAGTADILLPTANRVIRNGTPVVFTFTATDAGPAGLDAADATDDLDFSATNGTTTLSTYTVSAVESAGVVTYTVTLTVPVTATTGTYAVSASVLDRSGNESSTATLGSFEIGNEVIATVELEGFLSSGSGTRDVVFIATGGASKTWTKTVSFSSSVGSVALEDVPAGTTSISAKSAWTLRSKLAVPFGPTGVGAASFTGVDKLNAGDINNDNVINTLDYSILRFNWLTTFAGADLTGNGTVASDDYNLLQANFYTVGDAQ